MRLVIEIEDAEIGVFLTKLKQLWNIPLTDPDWLAKQQSNAAKAREGLKIKKNSLKGEITKERVESVFKPKPTVSAKRKAQLSEVCALMREKRLAKLAQQNSELHDAITHQPDKVVKKFCYKCQHELIREYYENPKTHQNYHKQCYPQEA